MTALLERDQAPGLKTVIREVLSSSREPLKSRSLIEKIHSVTKASDFEIGGQITLMVNNGEIIKNRNWEYFGK